MSFVSKSRCSIGVYLKDCSPLLLLFFFYFILSRLLYLAFSANIGLLCMPHPGMGPLVQRSFQRMAE